MILCPLVSCVYIFDVRSDPSARIVRIIHQQGSILFILSGKEREEEKKGRKNIASIYIYVVCPYIYITIIYEFITIYMRN